MACIDGSAYTRSVCDHAAWLASATSAPILALHVDESTAADRPLASRLDPSLELAQSYFIEQGVDDVRVTQRGGRFQDVGVNIANGCAVTVMGKRGLNSDGDRRAIGSSVYPMLRQAKRPVCLVSQHFFPVSHALVLLDGDPRHRRTVDYVARHPIFMNLGLDLVVMTGEAGDSQSKLSWARSVLNAKDAKAFEMATAGPNEAVSTYAESRGYDLLILSREIVLKNIDNPLVKAGEQSFWSWRAPVFVC